MYFQILALSVLIDTIAIALWNAVISIIAKLKVFVFWLMGLPSCNTNTYFTLKSCKLHCGIWIGSSNACAPPLCSLVLTTMCLSLSTKLTAEQVLTFFQPCGEIKYVRMAGDETQPTRCGMGRRVVYSYGKRYRTNDPYIVEA